MEERLVVVFCYVVHAKPDAITNQSWDGRRIGSWCEMAASLWEHESRSRGSSTVKDATEQHSEDSDWEHYRLKQLKLIIICELEKWTYTLNKVEEDILI
jgi:hypothetical protein